MSEYRNTQTNFTSGEMSPRLFGRSDLEKYRSGLQEQLNFITQKHGGVIRRSGTKFVATAKTQASATRMVPFEFSVVQTYVMEFGDLYVRFYRDRGRLQHGTSFVITGAAWALSVATITVAAHSLQIGDQVSVQGVVTDDDFTGGFNGTFTVVNRTSTTFTYALTLDPLGTYVSGGTAMNTSGLIATEIVTTYTAAQLAELKWTQSADVLYLTHPDHTPRTLSRTAGADSDPAIWQLTDFDTAAGPWLTFNLDDAAVFAFGAADVNDLVLVTSPTAASRVACINAINGGLGFLATDVGRLFGYREGNNLYYGPITVVTDKTSVTIEAVGVFVANPVTLDWSVGSWSSTSGFPHAVTFHQQRLWFGATDDEPQTIWASAVGDFTNFSPFDLGEPGGDVLDTTALVFTISDDRVNTIHWMKSDTRGLMLMTNGGVFLGGGQDAFDPVTPSNFTVTRQITDTASERAAPQQASSVVLVPTGASRKILEVVFRFEDDRFVAPDMTILSEHITLGGIIDTAYMTEPDNVFWAIRSDGQLLGMTNERNENVVAWHRHVLGGTLTGSDQPAVESIAIIRDSEVDLIWMVVRRTIDGNTTRYIEFMDTPFKDDQITEDAFQVDAGITLDDKKLISAATKASPVVITTTTDHGYAAGNTVRIRNIRGMVQLNQRTFTVAAPITPTTFALLTEDGTNHTAWSSGGQVNREVTVLTGLGHLAGESVQILADGGTHPNKTVSGGGGVTLNRKASIVHAGLGFTSRVKSMPMVPTVRIESRGAILRIDHVNVRYNRTLGGQVGADLGTLDAVVYRHPADAMDEPVPLFSGILRLATHARHGHAPFWQIETTDPLPMNILSVSVEAGVEGV